MATVALGNKAVGSTVKLKIGGVAKDFLVVHQGKPSSIYDESCNGTWLLMKDIYETRQWHSSNVNDYAASTIQSYLNSTFLNLLDANIKGAVKQVKIPYRPGSGTSQSINSGANGLSAKIFLLSDIEVGYTQSNVNQYIVNDGAKLSYFKEGNSTAEKIAYLNGSATYWWLRSPYSSNANYAWVVSTNGSASYNGCAFTYGIRPALILPSTLFVSDDGSVATNTAPSAPSSISVPGTVTGGTTITVSWGQSTDAEGNLEGYIVERSGDGGSTWSQIYQGGALTTNNAVAFGTPSVMFRVKAYDNQGLQSPWKSSSQVTVINNAAPGAPASINVPLTVDGGKSITITWGAATDSDGNLVGYALDRKVDNGAWAEIYRGNALSHTDAITKGWGTVTYRVRSYDSYTAYSAYTTSQARTVNNNTPPTISCASPSGTNLGNKSAGFSVSYTVADVDNDAITVTESIDGVVKRTFSAALDVANSFAVTGDYFMQLVNGAHTMTIAAADAKATTTHTLAFTKTVHSASITMGTPMDADAQITLAVLSVIGFIPADAVYKVEVTNNAKDPEPVWEDATAAVKGGANIVIENATAANGFAFNFRITVSRGSSGEGGHISSVQGGFQ